MAALDLPNRYLNTRRIHRMTKKELWAIYVKRNPSFEGEGNVTLSKRGLRKLFDTTWDTAYYDGEEGEYQDICDSANLDALKRIFGMS